MMHSTSKAGVAPHTWPVLARRRPAPGPVRLFKKWARRRLKTCKRACAPNVLHAARLGSCRHKIEWATAGTLSGSLATITRPWRTECIFANRLRGTDFRPLNLRFWKIPQKWLICTFFGEKKKIKISSHGVLSGNCQNTQNNYASHKQCLQIQT